MSRLRENSIIGRIRNLTSMDIEGLKRSEIESLLLSGARSHYSNVQNLSKSVYKASSSYLSHRDYNLPKKYTEKQIKKMKLPELKRAFKSLVRESKIQSSTITGATEIVKKISKESGVEVSKLLELTPDNWEQIHDLIKKGVNSDQIITYASKYRKEHPNFTKEEFKLYCEKETGKVVEAEIEAQDENEIYTYDAEELVIG